MRTRIDRMSTADLEAELDRIESLDDASDADIDRGIAIERELDARELWNHDDARVRESVGNYGEAGR